jgi:ATP-binding cassette subfamily C (CFTR/MRP) protein 4
MMKSAKDADRGMYSDSNCLSKLLFWWITPLLYKGFKSDLELKDLDQVTQTDKAKLLEEGLLIHFSPTQSKSKASDFSLTKSIFRTFGKQYCLMGLLVFINECCIQIIQPLLLGYLIRYFSNPELYPKSTGLLMASGIVLLTLLLTLIHHTFCFTVMRIGMRIRVACSSLIYSKSLKLKQSSIAETTTGKIMNLLGNDLTRIDQLSFSFHYLWVGPLQELEL